MTKTQILAIILFLIVLYGIYQHNNQPNLNIQSPNQQIQDLKQQARHYQTLYQKRVEKDLAVDQSTQIQHLTLTNQQLENNLACQIQTKNLYSQKIKDLESSLFNLAKQKQTITSKINIFLNQL